MMKKKHPSIKVRRKWKIKPATKRKESAKIYRREALRRSLRREILGEI